MSELTDWAEEKHIHWPLPVEDMWGELVGRYICRDCLDECSDCVWLGVEGEECPTKWVEEDIFAQTLWVLTKDGPEMFHYSVGI